MTTTDKILRFISIVVAAMTLFGFAVFARAEEPPKPTPSISAEQRATFWRSLAEATQAGADKIAADNKQKAADEKLKANISVLTQACGTWQLQLDPKTGEPACIEPPKVEEKAK